MTILTTADPVKVFEDFATVDLISGGRAEVIAGRGVFTESFPLLLIYTVISYSVFRGKAGSSASHY